MSAGFSKNGVEITSGGFANALSYLAILLGDQ